MAAALKGYFSKVFTTTASVPKNQLKRLLWKGFTATVSSAAVGAVYAYDVHRQKGTIARDKIISVFDQIMRDYCLGEPKNLVSLKDPLYEGAVKIWTEGRFDPDEEEMLEMAKKVVLDYGAKCAPQGKV